MKTRNDFDTLEEYVVYLETEVAHLQRELSAEKKKHLIEKSVQ